MSVCRDYAEWLTPERLEKEIAAWEAPVHVAEQREMGQQIARFIETCRLHSVEEWGCGIGWLSEHLPPAIEYTGFDKYPGCIEEAKRRYPEREFVTADIRDEFVQKEGPIVDLVCSISMLKHIPLGEWATIFAKVVSRGRYAVVSLRGAGVDAEDDTEFPCVWVRPSTLHRGIRLANHEMIGTKVVHSWNDRWEGLVMTVRREQRDGID